MAKTQKNLWFYGLIFGGGSDSLALARSRLFLLAPFLVLPGTFVEELLFRGLVQHRYLEHALLSKMNDNK